MSRLQNRLIGPILDNFHQIALLFALKFSKIWTLTANFSFRPVKTDRLLAWVVY